VLNHLNLRRPHSLLFALLEILEILEKILPRSLLRQLQTQRESARVVQRTASRM
jgi:hypothetical protein